MIVKLVRAVVEETGRGSPDASTWLQMGEEYVVLSVDVTWRDVNNNWIDLQIHNPDEASPYDWGYWSIHHFEVSPHRDRRSGAPLWLAPVPTQAHPRR